MPLLIGLALAALAWLFLKGSGGSAPRAAAPPPAYFVQPSPISTGGYDWSTVPPPPPPTYYTTASDLPYKNPPRVAPTPVTPEPPPPPPPPAPPAPHVLAMDAGSRSLFSSVTAALASEAQPVVWLNSGAKPPVNTATSSTGARSFATPKYY